MLGWWRLEVVALVGATLCGCDVDDRQPPMTEQADRTVDDAVDVLDLVDEEDVDAAASAICTTDTGDCGCLVPDGGSCAEFGNVAACLDAAGKVTLICQSQSDGACVCTPPLPPPPRPFPRLIEPIPVD